ncbi:histidine phosphatase family protein [Streptomyces kaniharaensis]|uniref:Histidine phosphatase family protein n=1 Tax=Streptomyces kaniharaensis TaxID=212423 RepID=A0A6N7KVU2_9ACTN|nr:histidine phosphatase family protein [Streptomyces kaniharaensis]
MVLRHAKSAWPDVADVDRPLAPRGRRDAPEAGRWLGRRGLVPDVVVSSPARRARETWELVAAQLPGRPVVGFDPEVYGADADGLVRVLRGQDRRAGTVLLVGHNPAMQELVLQLAAGTGGDALGRVREKFPTCGLAVLELSCEWSELGESAASLVDFAIPRGARD